MKAAVLSYSDPADGVMAPGGMRSLEAFASGRVCDTLEKKVNSVKGKSIPTTVHTEAPTHETLVVRIAENRDRAAFKELFGYFAPRLKSYLMNLGLGGEKAEDLAQEVMVTVWQKAHQFDPAKAKLSTWMFRIARNKFIDLKRRQKYPEVDADDHLKEFVAPETTDEPIIAGQTAERVTRALTVLKDNQRQVIELSFYEELSHSQIAEKLELPLGTVKSRIRIAFQALRKELGEME